MPLTANSYVLPQEDSSEVPRSLKDQYKNAAKLAAIDEAEGFEKGYESIRGSLSTSLKTKNGTDLMVISKEGGKDVQYDLWEDLVAPGIESDIFTETWCVCSFEDRDSQEKKCQEDGRLICDAEGQEDPEKDRPYCCQKSVCDREHRVQQILQLDFSGYYEKNDRLINSIETHAKWAMGQSSEDPWVCFGDINRQPSQRWRGGGALCMRDEDSHKVVSKFVKEVDECED